jgi:hypothetical protein
MYIDELAEIISDEIGENIKYGTIRPRWKAGYKWFVYNKGIWEEIDMQYMEARIFQKLPPEYQSVKLAKKILEIFRLTYYVSSEEARSIWELAKIESKKKVNGPGTWPRLHRRAG